MCATWNFTSASMEEREAKSKFNFNVICVYDAIKS